MRLRTAALVGASLGFLLGASLLIWIYTHEPLPDRPFWMICSVYAAGLCAAIVGGTVSPWWLNEALHGNDAYADPASRSFLKSMPKPFARCILRL